MGDRYRKLGFGFRGGRFRKDKLEEREVYLLLFGENMLKKKGCTHLRGEEERGKRGKRGEKKKRRKLTIIFLSSKFWHRTIVGREGPKVNFFNETDLERLSRSNLNILGN